MRTQKGRDCDSACQKGWEADLSEGRGGEHGNEAGGRKGQSRRRRTREGSRGNVEWQPHRSRITHTTLGLKGGSTAAFLQQEPS